MILTNDCLFIIQFVVFFCCLFSLSIDWEFAWRRTHVAGDSSKFSLTLTYDWLLSPLQTSTFFYDRFCIYDKFNFLVARVYVRHIFFDKFFFDKFYLVMCTVNNFSLARIVISQALNKQQQCIAEHRHSVSQQYIREQGQEHFVACQIFLWQPHLLKS